MSTLAEIEMAVPHFSAEELAELEQFIRRARREKERAQRPSLRDIRPASVGRILEPVGSRDGWYDGCWRGRRDAWRGYELPRGSGNQGTCAECRRNGSAR